MQHGLYVLAVMDRRYPPHLDEDYLVLSTIHSAKSQEWDAVFVLNATDGCIPSDMAAGSRDQSRRSVGCSMIPRFFMRRRSHFVRLCYKKGPFVSSGQILGLMVEGTSIRSISRLTGASKNTVVKLLEDAGEAFSDYQDRTLRNLTCKRVQVDEIWAFVYAKAKNVKAAKAAPDGAGDCWTWLAIDPDTKLIPSFYIGARDADAAQHFIGDLALRSANRVQLTRPDVRLR